MRPERGNELQQVAQLSLRVAQGLDLQGPVVRQGGSTPQIVDAGGGGADHDEMRVQPPCRAGGIPFRFNPSGDQGSAQAGPIAPRPQAIFRSVKVGIAQIAGPELS